MIKIKNFQLTILLIIRKITKKIQIMKLLAAIALPTLVLGQTTYTGYCPNISGTPKFDLQKYIETPWFTPLASPFMYSYPEISSCVTATYRESEKYPGYVDVINSNILFKRWRYTVEGYAVEDPNATGELAVSFSGKLPNPENSNYIVLDTDNENYAYVWNCENVEFEASL